MIAIEQDSVSDAFEGVNVANRRLSRLDRIWLEQPIFFVTSCTHRRRHLLTTSEMHVICREVWDRAKDRQGWIVGRYVLMPDHVHFFCTPRGDKCRLEQFVGKWKEWTAKFARRRLRISPPFWQPGFFDHLLRSGESYEEKWRYVRNNPVRAGLIVDADSWPFQGELHELHLD